MSDDSGSTSRRPRLTRELVIATALRLVDLEGVDALTMRRLGQELGRDPMALYRYAASRSDLLDGVAELVVSELVIDVDVQDWQHELRQTAHEFRRLALAHPHVVPLIVTRPLATPLALRPVGTLRPLEQMLELLAAVGYPPVRALHVYRSFWGLLHGHVLNELQELVVDPEETDALLRTGLHQLSRTDFPRLRGLAEVLLAGYDGAATLDDSLDLLFSGLDADDVPRGPAPADLRPEMSARSGNAPTP